MGIIKKFRITTFKKEIPKISLKRISLSFNKRQILEDISFTVREGEICGLLGPNGVGKSTVFNIIIGLIAPDFGNVYIDQKKVTNIPIYKRCLDHGVSICPQTSGIFSDLTCLQNLTAIAEIVIKNKNERMHKIENMIAKFELEAVKNIKSKYVSGGQKKKISLAMSLLSDPKIIILDEPFSGLDLMSIRELQQTIVNLQTEDSSRACIISDHSAKDLLTISDKIFILANKKIISQGTPTEVLNDENARSVYFPKDFKLN